MLLIPGITNFGEGGGSNATGIVGYSVTDIPPSTSVFLYILFSSTSSDRAARRDDT